MNDFGFNEYNALYQRMYGPKPEKDKAGWLDPALTAAGAIAGTMLMPGAGTAAGASLGHAAGGAAHSAANGDASGAIQGAMGLPAFWQQFAPYIGTFAEGGMVPDPEQEQQGNPMSMLTPELIAQIQQHAQTLAGPAPTAPTATPLRQPSHPTLETLATLMPAILGSLPKPANPKNTKAIGAWAPFAGNVMAAPALIAQARRKAANTPTEDANTQAQSDYEARQKAYEDQKKAYGTALIQGAMRPQGQAKEPAFNRFNEPVPEDLRKTLGVPPSVKTYGQLDEWQQMQTRIAGAAGGGQNGQAQETADDIETFAGHVADLRTDPTISMAGRSQHVGIKLKNRINEVLKARGIPYSYQQLKMYWDDYAKFVNTQEGQRFQSLRQSALTVNKHLKSLRGLYRDLANISPPSGWKTIGKTKMQLALEGAFGDEIQARANSLLLAQDFVAGETAMLLSGGYAPKEEQVTNANQRLQLASFSRRAGEATLNTLEDFLKARVAVWQKAAPILGGDKNPYFHTMGIAPLDGWEEVDREAENAGPIDAHTGDSSSGVTKPPGYMPPGAKPEPVRKGR